MLFLISAHFNPFSYILAVLLHIFCFICFTTTYLLFCPFLFFYLRLTFLIYYHYLCIAFMLFLLPLAGFSANFTFFLLFQLYFLFFLASFSCIIPVLATFCYYRHSLTVAKFNLFKLNTHISLSFFLHS